MELNSKEASNILKENLEGLLNNPQVILDDSLVEATNMAIKALEAESTSGMTFSTRLKISNDFLKWCCSINKDSDFKVNYHDPLTFLSYLEIKGLLKETENENY